MFLVSRELRGQSTAKAALILKERLAQESEDFSTADGFRLHGMNRRQIQRLLARMTDYVETRSGHASHFVEYVAGGKKAYEVEHIWANHPERHSAEFNHPSEFAEYRNRLGGLLLLPKSFNDALDLSKYLGSAYSAEDATGPKVVALITFAVLAIVLFVIGSRESPEAGGEHLGPEPGPEGDEGIFRRRTD